MIQYQILQTNITRTVWQTVRRITNEILGVKGLELNITKFSVVLCNLTIGSYVSMLSSRYEACGKFGEHERCVRVARGVAESNSSFLSALQTFRMLHISMNAQLTYEPMVNFSFLLNGCCDYFGFSFTTVNLKALYFISVF